MRCWWGLLFVLLGCQRALERQPRVHTYDNPRAPVEGTIAFDDPKPVATPLTITELERGRERYDIYCAVCHDFVGEGHGMAVQRGFPAPPTFHDARARAWSDTYIMHVIRDGHDKMRGFAAEVDASDRQAITAYVRALQLSQNFPAERLSPGEREAMEATP